MDTCPPDRGGPEGPSSVNDSLSALPHPQREREESLGDWNNVTAALRRDSQPPALLPGALGTPLTTSRHRAVSGLAPGTCSSFLGPRLAWESPRGRLIVPLLHFSSAALFPLSASYKLQRLHRKVWLPLRPLLRRRWAQVSCWRGRLHNQVPPRLSQNPGRLPGPWGAGYKAMLSLGYFGSWCLRRWAHALCFPALMSEGMHSFCKSLRQGPWTSQDSWLAVSCSVKHRPVCSTKRPNKAEETKV